MTLCWLYVLKSYYPKCNLNDAALVSMESVGPVITLSLCKTTFCFEENKFDFTTALLPGWYLTYHHVL